MDRSRCVAQNTPARVRWVQSTVALSRQLTKEISMKIKYPFLLATLAFLALAFCLVGVGAITLAKAGGMVLIFQIAMISLDRQRPALFMAALSQSQVDEFTGLLDGLKDLDVP